MFNIQSIIYQILSSLSITYGPLYPELKGQIEGFLNSAMDRLKDMTTAAINGDLPIEYVKARLLDETIILKMELLSLVVEGESVAQDAYNSALTTLETAINGILPIATPAPKTA